MEMVQLVDALHECHLHIFEDYHQLLHLQRLVFPSSSLVWSRYSIQHLGHGSRHVSPRQRHVLGKMQERLWMWLSNSLYRRHVD